MDSPDRIPRIEPTQEAMEAAANDKDAIACRSNLARFSAGQLVETGTELHVIGHLLVSDGTIYFIS
jgi:hypothetical protein